MRFPRPFRIGVLPSLPRVTPGRVCHQLQVNFNNPTSTGIPALLPDDTDYSTVAVHRIRQVIRFVLNQNRGKIKLESTYG
ncbi:MAG: hypothetical protein WCB86_08215 [Candidatus Dormiibacterota bacterium]